MKNSDIFQEVCDIIELSTGVSKSEMKPDSTLFDDLAIDSIDLVDILFELEMKYDVELKISDIEKGAKDDIGADSYEQDGVITPAGLEAIKKRMPEIDHSQLHSGMTMQQLAKLFNIESLCRIVETKLNG